MGYDEGPNLYSYVDNSPWLLGDLYGESVFTQFGGLWTPWVRGPEGEALSVGQHGIAAVGHGLTDVGLNTFEFGDRLWFGAKNLVLGRSLDMGAFDRGWGVLHSDVDSLFGDAFGVNTGDPWYGAMRKGARIGTEVGMLYGGIMGLSRGVIQLANRLPAHAETFSGWAAVRGAVAGGSRGVRGSETVATVSRPLAGVEYTPPRIDRIYGPKMEGSPCLGSYDWTYTRGVYKHYRATIPRGGNAGCLERPFMESTQFVNEIMSSKGAMLDSRMNGAIRWDVQGYLNGGEGVWELVIHPSSRRIVHYTFKGK